MEVREQFCGIDSNLPLHESKDGALVVRLVDDHLAPLSSPSFFGVGRGLGSSLVGGFLFLKENLIMYPWGLELIVWTSLTSNSKSSAYRLLGLRAWSPLFSSTFHRSLLCQWVRIW